MSSNDNVDVYLLLGLGAGIYFFFKGFSVYKEFRVFEDTPEIPIRSMAMGLSHIHGKALGDQLVESPVTRTQCLFYKVDIERWVTDKNGGHWSHYKTDADGPLFYLEDPSGKVLINAHNAEYDLIQTGRRATGGVHLNRGSLNLGSLFAGKSNSAAVLPTPTSYASDTDLLSYVASVHGVSKFAMSSMGFGFSGGLSLGSSISGQYRLTEYLILPDHWYDVIGTCTENSAAKDDHDRNMIMKGQNEPTFLISWRNEKQEESVLKRRAMGYIFGGAALSVVCFGILLARFGWL